MHARDAKLAEYRALLKNTRQQRNRAWKRSEQDEHPDSEDADFKIDRIRSVKLSTKGSLAVALRRSIGNSPAYRFGAALLEDISRHAVVRSEIMCGAALTAAARAWHREVEQCIYLRRLQGQDTARPSLVVVAFASDATNSNVWQGCKVQSTEVTSLWLGDRSLEASIDKSWAETQIIIDASAAGTHSLLRKQLGNLGVKLWPSACDPKSKGTLDSVSTQHEVLRVFFYNSDRGPDQVKFRSVAASECAEDLWTWWWAADCSCHCAHLCVKTGLTAADQFLASENKSYKHFATIAKVINLWRAKAHLMFRSFEKHWGTKTALEHADKLPPRALSGRWGSVEHAECWLDDAGAALLTPVLQDVLAKTANADGGKDAGGDEAHPAEPDELRVQEMAAFRQKMSRWSREALTAVQDKFFWCTLKIMRWSHAPLSHHLNFVQKNLEPADIESNGGHLAQLVCGKAQKIVSEWEVQLGTNPIWDNILDEAPLSWHRSLIQFMTFITLHHAAAYHRRNVRPLSKMPLSLFLLVKQPPTVVCEERKRSTLSCLGIERREPIPKFRWVLNLGDESPI